MLCTFICCDFFVFAIALLNSYFNHCFHECYCIMCYMYLQVIQINIIIITKKKKGLWVKGRILHKRGGL